MGSKETSGQKRPRSPSTDKPKKPALAAKRQKTEVPPKAKTPTPQESSDFVRGGAQRMSALEIRKINKQAALDITQEPLPEPKVVAKKLRKKKTQKRERVSTIKMRRKEEQRQKMSDAMADALVDSDDEKLPSYMIEARAPKKTVPISFKSLNEGDQILGCIRQIRPAALIISLPNNLTAHIPIHEVSDVIFEKLAHPSKPSKQEDEQEDDDLPDLFQMFEIGQQLRCMITSIVEKGEEQAHTTSTKEGDTNRKSKKRIAASIRASKFHSNGIAVTAGNPILGCVKSEEDRGYRIDFGVAHTEGFLAKSSDNGEEKPLKIGQPVETIVDLVKKSSTNTLIKVSLKKTDAELIDFGGNQVTLKDLSVGMVVESRIVKVLRNPHSLFVSFLSFFSGIVDLSYFPGKLPPFKSGMKIRAKIVLISSETKSIRLSVQPHLVNGEKFSFPPEYSIGTITTAHIRSSKSSVGLSVLLKSPTNEKEQEHNQTDDENKAVDLNVAGFLHPNQLSDGPITEFEKEFPSGKNIKVRVLSLNYFDGIIHLTAKPSSLEQTYWSVSDLKVGEVVRGKVKQILENDRGVSVSVSENIHLLVPYNHLADVQIRKPGAKFKIGQKVTGRVLSLKSGNKNRALLTLKKSLVQSNLPVITSLDQVHENLITHAYIVKVMESGLILGFFNRLSAYVPVSQLSSGEIDKVSSVFSVGQVVKCRVLRKDEGKQRFLASLKLQLSDDEKQFEQAFESLSVGDVVDLKLTKKTDDSLIFSTKEGAIKARILINHLSDFPLLSKRIHENLEVGDEISGALILNKRKEKHRALECSLKQTLISSSPSSLATSKMTDSSASTNQAQDTILFPNSADQIKPGVKLIGYIKSMTSLGVFVSFLGDLVGFVQKKSMADRYVTDNLEKFYQLGQTVVAHVLDVQAGTQKVYLSLKQSIVGAGSYGRPDHILSNYFDQVNRLETIIERRLPKPSFSVGSTVSGTVEQIITSGVVIDLENDSTFKGLALNYQTEGVELEAGSLVKGKIIDIDRLKAILDLSLRPELVNMVSYTPITRGRKSKPSKESSPSHPLTVGEQIVGKVELVKSNYMVFSIVKDEQVMFAFGPTNQFNSVVLIDPFSIFKPGMKFPLVVEALPSAEKHHPLFVRLTLIPEKRQSTKKASSSSSSSSSSSIQDFEIGSLVSGKVIKINPSYVILSIGNHVTAHLHITEIFDHLPESTVHPFSRFSIGNQVTDAKILKVQDIAPNKLLPISHQNPLKRRVLEVSVKPSELSIPSPALGPARISIESLCKGQIVLGFVHEVTKDCLWVHLSSSCRGRIFLLDLTEDVQILQNLLEHFKPGQPIESCVISFNSERNSIDLSARLVPTIRAALEKLQQQKAQPTKKGSKQALQKKKEKLADPVTGEVDTTADVERQNLISSVLKQYKSFEPGSVIMGRVLKFSKKSGLNVQIDSHRKVKVFFTDIQDEYLPVKKMAALYQPNQFIRCKVISESDSGKIYVSTRTSLTQTPSEEGTENQSIVDPIIESVKDVKPGMIVRGFIKSSSKKGVFVSLSKKIDGRIMLSNLADRYVKKLDKEYPPNKLIRCKVLSIEKKDTDSSFIELTAKRSVIKGKKLLEFSDLKEGMKVAGYVKNITTFGLFVELKGNSRLVGLCHRSEVSDKEIDHLTTFSINDYVYAMIMSVDPIKKKFSLSLKPSHFSEEDFQEEDDSDNDDDDDDDEDEDEDNDNDDSDSEEEDQNKEASENGGDDEEKEKEEDDDDEDEEKESETNENDHEVKNSSLDWKKNLKGGFSFDEFSFRSSNKTMNDKDQSALEDSEDEDDESDQESTLKVLTKAQKKAQKQKQKKQTEEIERSLIDQTKLPETIADYERLLVASPQESHCWIKYMAFLVSVAELDKAREVAERGLKKIDPENEEEKLNLWSALLNLEHEFGTNSSLNAIIERAVAYNDAKKIHTRILEMYLRAEELKEAEELLKKMVVKYKHSSKVWLMYGQFLIEKRGDSEATSALLQRALRQVSSKKNPILVSKFCQIEYKAGNIERARTMMEGLIGNYPTRNDLWMVYVDMELKHTANVENVRNIFERAASLNLSSKKMRGIFKKFLQFEKQKGDEASVDHVKQLATQYLKSKE